MIAWIGIRPSAMSWPPERRAADANGAAQRFSQIFLAQQPANNFAALGLGELSHRAHGLWFERGPKRVDEMQRKLLFKFGRDRDAGLI